MQWHREENKRQMPWKGVKDPYKIWLSEVILQQTRVEQGWPYYERFIKQYPTIKHLAAAKDEAVFKLWEGLGYYSRCRNLLFTARKIVNDYAGVFPDDYETIASLKGIGPYTASAIASFCFDLPYAVVDGNVFRVLSRIFCVDLATDSTAGKKYFTELAAKVLDPAEPGAFNQAIMDFGATVCKPALPACSACSLHDICKAYKTGMVNQLPLKEKVIRKKNRWFSYFVFMHGDKMLVHQRTSKDIWQNLYEYFIVETESDPHWNEAMINEFMQGQLGAAGYEIISLEHAAKQQLTHQFIHGYFIKIKLSVVPEILQQREYSWVNKQQKTRLAFPGFINQHFQNNSQTQLIL